MKPEAAIAAVNDHLAKKGIKKVNPNNHLMAIGLLVSSNPADYAYHRGVLDLLVAISE